MPLADVFLSYARNDGAAAKAIAGRLRDNGFSVWFDEQLPAHRPYADIIEEQLEQAGAVLVLWSADAVRSQWVRSEANRARELRKLVQLRLDNVRLPMPFDQIQCADLSDWRSGGAGPSLQTILDSIGQLTGTTAMSAVGSKQSTSRRSVLVAGGAAAILSAGGFLAWREFRSPALSPEAQLLLQKGLDALQANDALDPEDEGTTAQAIALLTDATEAAPHSATAWGGLALAYAVRRRTAPLTERSGLDVRGRTAAKQALLLDSREPRALAARQLMDPVYRHWLTAERAAREALAKNPRFPILLFVLSDVLGSVGRWQDATKLSNKLDRKRFLLPGADRKVIVNLWAAGQLQAADQAMEAAAARWPDQRQIWRTRVSYLMYSGRPAEALAIIEDRANRPLDVMPDVIDAAAATARGLAGRGNPADSIAANLRFLSSHPERALAVAQAITVLGDSRTAMTLLTGYYFGEGDWAKLAPPGGDRDRLTAALFQPPMLPLWNSQAFESLLQRIGLTSYWQQSGTVPDYRRSG